MPCVESRIKQRIFLYIISVCIVVSWIYKMQVESFLLISFFRVFSLAGGALVICYCLFTVLTVLRFNEKTMCKWDFTSSLKDILVREEFVAMNHTNSKFNFIFFCLVEKAINENDIFSKWWSGNKKYFCL